MTGKRKGVSRSFQNALVRFAPDKKERENERKKKRERQPETEFISKEEARSRGLTVPHLLIGKGVPRKRVRRSE